MRLGDAVRIINWTAKENLFAAKVLSDIKEGRKIDLTPEEQKIVDDTAMRYGLNANLQNNARVGTEVYHCNRNQDEFNCAEYVPSKKVNKKTPMYFICDNCKFLRKEITKYKTPDIERFDEVIDSLRIESKNLLEMKRKVCEMQPADSIIKYQTISGKNYKVVRIDDTYAAHCPVSAEEEAIIKSGNGRIVPEEENLQESEKRREERHLVPKNEFEQAIKTIENYLKEKN